MNIVTGSNMYHAANYTGQKNPTKKFIAASGQGDLSQPLLDTRRHLPKGGRRMKSDGIFKQAVAVFIVALAIYIIGYHAIEDRRTRNGPWQVAFTNDVSGAPALLINQPRLALTNVLIIFSEATNPASNTVLTLTQPRLVPFDVPFGKCIFMDATSLPGTLVFELFGHEIQLLPRVLTIDKLEQPWRSGETQILKSKPTPRPR